MLRSVVCKQLLDAAQQSGCRSADTPNREALPEGRGAASLYAEALLEYA